MRFFRFIAQFFGEPIYCEDCVHRIPRNEDTIFSKVDMCKAHPIEVECGHKDDYVKRGAKVKIIDTFKTCKEVRSVKIWPVEYSETCWKFDKKVLDK